MLKKQDLRSAGLIVEVGLGFLALFAAKGRIGQNHVESLRRALEKAPVNFLPCQRVAVPQVRLIDSMQDKIRQRVQFGQLNLCKPFCGLGPFDVIFLRNVLIYFDPATKVDVVDRVLALLKPGGLFFLGTAEGRVPCKTPLQTVIPGAFRKLN